MPIRLRNCGLIVLCLAVLCAALTPMRVKFAVQRSADELVLGIRTEDNNKTISARTSINESTVVVTFNHPVTGDVSRLARAAPDLISLARLNQDGQSLTLTLKRPLAVARDTSNGRVRLTLTAPEGQAAIGEGPEIGADGYAADDPNRPRGNPVPSSGVVSAEIDAADRTQVVVSFQWADLVGAAVFRRGDAIWVIFDAEAKLNMEEAVAASRFMRNVQLIRGPGFSGFRAKVEPSMLLSAETEGTRWRIRFGNRREGEDHASLVTLRQAKEGVGSRLMIRMENATNVFWLEDPDARDRIAVVTAIPPTRGLATERALVDAILLETAQGFVVAPRRDDLLVSLEGDHVALERPNGLALSGGLVRQARAAPVAYFKDASGGDFMAQYDALLRNAAIEAATPRGPANARTALARFLVENELASEANGLLSLMLDMDPTLGTESQVRLLRGAARAMMGRIDDARLDLQVIGNDPVAALWRGYVESEDMSWFEARREFEAGLEGLSTLPRDWRARMLTRLAEAHFELNDMGAARMAVLKALAEKPSPDLRLQAHLIGAKIMVAQNNPKVGRLLAILAASPNEEVAARAALEQTVFLLKVNEMTPKAGIDAMQALRYRWRGDDYELEVARALGKLYMQMGDNRHGIEVMRAAWLRQPGNPVGRKLADELMGGFTHLFLDGGADELDPIQAVGMFYDFKELTPVGPDGDRMIRKLAQRLVAFDLLDQAAELLQYQVDERLDLGQVKARVATDLAAIYLMARKPEKAVQVISSSRYTLLPPELNRERRLLEARGLADLGRTDHALEIISNDNTPEARALRADVAWRMGDWPVAARRLEAVLGQRWSQAAPLQPDEQAMVLRLAIAYSLAGEPDALAKLAQQYGAKMASTTQAIAFQTVTSQADVRGAELREAAKRIADVDTFSSFSKRIKEKFASDPIPVEDAPAAAPAAQAAAPAAPAAAG